MSEDAQKIASGIIGIIHFNMKDEKGELLATSREDDDPMPYLHGAGNVVPGLEKALEGTVVGDALTVVIAPEDGYGIPDGPGPQGVPRATFPEDMPLEVGMPFGAEDEDGTQMTLWITKLEGDRVFVDANHPLSGKTLTFEVEVIGMREATDDEKVHGHPHGLDGLGHHHH